MKKILLFVVIIIACASCRTTTLNQTADTLVKGKAESTFTAALGVCVADSAGPEALIGVQQRFGLAEYLEMQFRFELAGRMLIYGIPIGAAHGFLDFGPKVKLFQKKNHAISISPFFGIYGGWDFYNQGTNGLFGILSGFRFIASYKFINLPSDTLFYGFTLNLKNDLLSIDKISKSINFGNITSIPFLQIDSGLSFGIESKKMIIHRHEFVFGFSFVTTLKYSPNYNNIISSSVNNFSISIAYGFTIGNEYSLQNIKK